MIELFTFLGSYVLSFLGTIFSQRSKAAQLHQTHIMQLAGLTEESVKAARDFGKQDPYTKTTRRVLAITMNVTFALVTLGFIYGVTNVEITETLSGFWPFTSDKEVTKFVQLEGGVILKEYRLIILSVFGLYFGNNHAK